MIVVVCFIIIRPTPDSSPRFRLYHAPSDISCKCRMMCSTYYSIHSKAVRIRRTVLRHYTNSSSFSFFRSHASTVYCFSHAEPYRLYISSLASVYVPLIRTRFPSRKVNTHSFHSLISIPLPSHDTSSSSEPSLLLLPLSFP